MNRMKCSLPLVLLGLAMVATDPWFAHIDDECAIIEAAKHPVRQTVGLFLHGTGQHEHPPLYDLILHGWLRITGARMRLLRLPAVLFFLAGLWALGQAAAEMEGHSSASKMVWIGALWPYGFHFGRLAGWYSFSFLLVALLTWAYVCFVKVPTRARWVWMFMSALALVYANYFAWALLGCLAIDFAVLHRQELATVWRPIVGTGLLLVVAYLPLWRPFWREVMAGVQPGGGHTWLGSLLSGVYNLYTMFVSESVGPWFWALSVPAGLGIAACLLVTCLQAPSASQRFFIYFVLLLASMTVLGIGNVRRLLLIAPWLLLPVAAALAITGNAYRRGVLALSLALVAAVGWYGIATRRYYGAPRWVEPWTELALEGAETVRQGGVVIADSTPFFFNLRYALAAGQANRIDCTFGPSPSTLGSDRVYDPVQWRTAGNPIGQHTLLIKGLHFGTPEGPMQETELWLDQRCALEGESRLVPDPGWKAKQRYFPQFRQLPWRIEARLYNCMGELN